MTDAPDLEPAALDAAVKTFQERTGGFDPIDDRLEIEAIIRAYLAARSAPEAGNAATKPLAFLVRNPMVPRVMNAIPAAPLPDEWLYPARRENDAREFAKLMRADLVPLYSLGGSDEERA